MRRRTFLAALAGGLVAAPRPADPQPAGRVHRIGYLAGGVSAQNPHFLAAFREGLRALCAREYLEAR